MSGKPRRRVTVENSKPLSESSEGKRKPSVFERLGPGAPPRNFDQQQSGSSGGERYEKQRVCNTFMKTGSCNYKGCRYSHPQRRESEDLRHKVGRRHDTTQSEDSPDESDSEVERKSRERRRHKRASRSHEKEGKIKSTVVMTKKNVPDVSDSDSEQWEAADDFDRDFESELELEKRRQQLQRELRNLQEAEAAESHRENMIIERQARVSSSDSDSSVSTPPKKDKRDVGRAPPEDHRKKISPKDKRKRVKKPLPVKVKQTRPVSPQPGRSRERESRRRDEPHSKRRPVPESSSDEDDDDDTSPEPRPEKERPRRRSPPEQRQRKRSPSSSEERRKSSVERRRKSPIVEHHRKSPDKRRKTSQPPRERIQKERDNEREREKERERVEREKERERERDREVERERERERPKVREKERHELPRKPVKESPPLKKGGRSGVRKGQTPEVSPRPDKRQRLDSPEYERKSHPPKRSVTPDERQERRTQSKERRSALQQEAKSKRSFSPKDITPKSRKHVSPADYKRSRTPEAAPRTRSPEPAPKVRRSRPEESRPRRQASPADSHKSESRHGSPEPRSHRHLSAEGRKVREPREREGREMREPREREGREVRETKEGRESRDQRDSHRDTRDGSREQRTNRDTREQRENKERDKEVRDRDQRDVREQRDRDTRERDGRDREGREREQKVGRERDIRETRDKDRKPKENWPPSREDRPEPRAESRTESRQVMDVNKRLAQIAQAGEVILPAPKISPEPLMERTRRRPAPANEPRSRVTEEEREPRRGRAAHSDGERPSKNTSPAPPRGRRRQDVSPEVPKVPSRTISPEARRGKERHPPERAAPPERGRGAASRAAPRQREARSGGREGGRETRENKERERDDSRGPRDRGAERDARSAPSRDAKEREPRSRDPKDREDVRDTHSSSSRNLDRGTERLMDRSIDRTMDRGGDRDMGVSPTGSRGTYDKSRSPAPPAPRRRDRSPDQPRGRRHTPDDARPQGPGHSPFHHDDYDAPIIHPENRMRNHPPDLMAEDYTHGRGRMGRGRNDRFVGHLMHDDHFDRPMDRPNHGERFDHGPGDDRRDRYRDHYDLDQDYHDRQGVDEDMGGHGEMWGDDQWVGPRDQGMQGRRSGRGRHGREDTRQRRGRGRGDGRRDARDEPFRYDDDEYLDDPMMVHDQWGMWDEHHPDNRHLDNRHPDNRRMESKRGGLHPEDVRPGDMDRRGRMFLDDRPDDRQRNKRMYDDEHTPPPPKRREMSPAESQHSVSRSSMRDGRDVIEGGERDVPRGGRDAVRDREPRREGRDSRERGARDRPPRDVPGRDRSSERGPQDRGPPERVPSERAPLDRSGPSERGSRPRGPERPMSDLGAIEPEDGKPREKRPAGERAKPRAGPTRADRPQREEGKRPPSTSPARPKGRKRPRMAADKPERRGDKPWSEGRPTPPKDDNKGLTDSPMARKYAKDFDESMSHGEEEAFSDWTNEEDDILSMPNRDEEEEIPLRPFHEAERSHRSPSRSSLGSRKSHRERVEDGRVLRNDDFRGARNDDIRLRNEEMRSGRVDDIRHGPTDAWSNPDPEEWQGGMNLPHRGLALQGEPHSPLEVASTPPWERPSRRRNRMPASGSETSEWDRERPPPPPPGSFGEAEAAVRAMEAERNGEAPAGPPLPPTAAPATPTSAPETPVAVPAPVVPEPTPEADEASTGKGELYDEISDDDLDDLIENAEADLEEKGKKTGVCDVLDIDWSNLVKESLPKSSTAGSALKRFTPANVFARIGVSRAFAGEALLTRLKHVCQKQLDKDASEEAGESTPPPTPQFELLNDVAALHAMEMKRRKDRANILQNIGPYRRALCARRDLVLRRYLCRLDQESDVTGLFATPMIDNDLYRQSLQFLRQGSSERKFSNSPPEPEPISA